MGPPLRFRATLHTYAQPHPALLALLLGGMSPNGYQHEQHHMPNRDGSVVSERYLQKRRDRKPARG